MNCETIKDRLPGFIDGTLDKEEMISVRRHLKSCPSCRGELRLLGDLFSGLSRLPVYEPGSDFNRAVFHRLGLEYQPYRRPAWLRLAMATGTSLALFWLSALAVSLPMLLHGAKAYKLAQWVHHPELILPTLGSFLLKAGLDLYQMLGMAAKVAGWIIKTSALPLPLMAASLLTLSLILISAKGPRTKMTI